MVRVAGLTGQTAAGVSRRSAGRPDAAADARRRARARARAVRQPVGALERTSCARRSPRSGSSSRSVEELEPEERGELDDRFEREIFPVLTPLAVGPGQPFPVHLRALDQPRPVRRRPRDRRGALRPGQGPGGSAALLPGRAQGPLRAAGASPLALPARALSRDGDPRAVALPRHARRRPRGLGRGRRPARGRRAPAAPRALRRGDAARGVGVDVAGDAASSSNRGCASATSSSTRSTGCSTSPISAELYEARPARPQERPVGARSRGRRGTRSSRPREQFAAIRAGDLLVHHPYDSFAASFESFLNRAASDPSVIAIKSTVYRTSDDTPLVPALIEASESGKQSVCLVEIKARGDERRNIEWSRALEQAGVHVVYGFPALKIHAKTTLVVRREAGGLRRYVHLGTGNYNAVTARVYEDFGLFTADEEIAADVADLFNHLTGFGRPAHFRKLLVAPFTLRAAADRGDPRRRRRGAQRARRRGSGSRSTASRTRGDRRALRRVRGRRADRSPRARRLLAAARRRRS